MEITHVGKFFLRNAFCFPEGTNIARKYLRQLLTWFSDFFLAHLPLVLQQIQFCV